MRNMRKQMNKNTQKIIVETNKRLKHVSSQ